MINIRQINPVHLEDQWPFIEERLKPAMKHADGLSLGRIYHDFEHEIRQIWLSYDDEEILGLVVTEIVAQENGQQVCWILLVVGKKLKSWAMPCLDQISTWALMRGCEKIQWISRPGIPRLIGEDFQKMFNQQKLFLERDLYYGRNIRQ